MPNILDIKKFDTRGTDKVIENFVNANFKKEFSSTINPNRIGILATMLIDAGGHTECIRRLVSNLSDKYEFELFLTRKVDSCGYAPQKMKAIFEHAKIDGFNCQSFEPVMATNLMFNLIKNFAPKVLFVFININDEISVAILALIKKYTNIKVIFFSHASHYPCIGYTFSDAVIVALESTYYIDKIYRKIDKHCILEMISDKVEEIKHFTQEEIQNKRKELEIGEDNYFTLSGGASYKFFDDMESPYFEMIKNLLEKEEKLKHYILSTFTAEENGIIDRIFKNQKLKDRLIILPRVSEYELIFQACDLFIDSFPVGAALTQIDLMKFKVPTVVKINNDNKLYTFQEYMPKEYPYMFDNVKEMENGILKLLHSEEERQKVIEMNYNHYLKTFEGNVVKQKYIDLIENIDNIEQHYQKADPITLNNFRIFSKEEEKKLALKARKEEEIKFEQQRQIKEANKRLKTAKIVHIMHNEKFDKDYVKLINKYFNQKEHAFLCSNNFVFNTNDFTPTGENVFYINDLKEIHLANPGVQKIICHSLIRNDLIDKLYKEPDLLKKAYWIMWGLDLYEAERDEKNDFVRKNLKGYIGKNDEEYAKNKYGMQGKFFDAHYNFPVKKEMLDATKKEQKNYLKIQINNSSDTSTIEMLDILSKFKDENIKITTILSYEPYWNMSYKNDIIQKGKKIFGDKFEYVNTWLKPDEYAQHLAENDILILYQNKQQGFGNTLASLYLGQKVFIRSDVSVNKYLNEQNIKIFNSDDIENMTFKEFVEYKEKETTCQNVRKYFEENYLVSLWQKVFEDK